MSWSHCFMSVDFVGLLKERILVQVGSFFWVVSLLIRCVCAPCALCLLSSLMLLEHRQSLSQEGKAVNLRLESKRFAHCGVLVLHH
jgi:hypothetical protein